MIKSKKAAGTMVSIIIAAVLMFGVTFAMVLIIYGEQALPKLRQTFDDVSSTAKELVKIGQPEANPVQATAPKDVIIAYEDLVSSFREGKKSSQERCLITYSEFPNLKKQNCRFSLSYERDYKSMRIDLFCNGLLVKSEKISDLWPCVVASKNTFEEKEYVAAENFYNNWISKKEPLKLPEYVAYYGLSITDKHDLKIKNTTTTTTYDLEDEKLKDDEGEEISYLYKANSKGICFMPTNDYYQFDRFGIDDDHIKDLNSKYNVPLCSK